LGAYWFGVYWQQLGGLLGLFFLLFLRLRAAAVVHCLVLSAVAGFPPVFPPLSPASWCIGLGCFRFQLLFFLVPLSPAFWCIGLVVFSVFSAFVACVLVYWLFVSLCP
jgi:hypothetical protein